jgi:hypothetical protein
MKRMILALVVACIATAVLKSESGARTGEAHATIFKSQCYRMSEVAGDAKLNDVDPATLQKLNELSQQCIKWVQDGTIPDQFYEEPIPY